MLKWQKKNILKDIIYKLLMAKNTTHQNMHLIQAVHLRHLVSRWVPTHRTEQ